MKCKLNNALLVCREWQWIVVFVRCSAKNKISKPIRKSRLRRFEDYVKTLVEGPNCSGAEFDVHGIAGENSAIDLVLLASCRPPQPPAPAHR